MLELDGFYKINVETDSQPGLIRDFFFFPGGNRDPALFQDHSGRARVQASPGGGGRSCIVMGEPLRERDLARSSSSLAPPISSGKPPGAGGGQLADGARIGILLSGDAGSARQRGLRS